MKRLKGVKSEKWFCTASWPSTISDADLFLMQLISFSGHFKYSLKSFASSFASEKVFNGNDHGFDSAIAFENNPLLDGQIMWPIYLKINQIK